MKDFITRHSVLSFAFICGLCILGLSLSLEKVFTPNPIIGLFDGIRVGFYTLLASVSASLLGFSIATLAIVIALMPSPRLKLVRESKHYASLYGIFLTAMKFLGLTTIVSFISLFIDTDRSPQVWLTYICLWSSILAFFSVYRCIWVMGRIVDIIVKPS